MKIRAAALVALFLAGAATPAYSAIVVDGNVDAAYGSASATVAANPAAPEANFGSPGPTARAGYEIYLGNDSSNVYGLVKYTGGDLAGNFANLYFDLNPTVADGSDLGFEIGTGGVTAFIPGKNGQPGFNKSLDSSLFQTALVPGGGLEFSLAESLFRSPISGLSYYNGQTFEDTITLRLSQSLSYSVAGGATYGPDRLGALTFAAAAALPEPATWAMMIGGFGMVGGAMRSSRRRQKVAFAAA